MLTNQKSILVWIDKKIDNNENKVYLKEFEETIIIPCPTCDEDTEMYYGICLNCGDESEKVFAINEMERPKWMPNKDLIGIEKAIDIREYLNEKEKNNNKE